MTSILETDRFRLREFRHGDLDELAAMVGDEDQMTFYPSVKSRDEASAWIGRNLGLYEQYGFGFWLIEAHATSEPLGYCGIRPLALEGAPETEMGWHIQRNFWNRGIATEAALRVRDLAFRRFGMSRLVAVIHPDHLASRRVAEKIGMDVAGVTVLDGYRAMIYARSTRSRSRSRPGQPG